VGLPRESAALCREKAPLFSGLEKLTSFLPREEDIFRQWGEHRDVGWSPLKEKRL